MWLNFTFLPIERDAYVTSEKIKEELSCMDCDVYHSNLPYIAIHKFLIQELVQYSLQYAFLN